MLGLSVFSNDTFHALVLMFFIICRANQWTSFFMITASVLKGLISFQLLLVFVKTSIVVDVNYVALIVSVVFYSYHNGSNITIHIMKPSICWQ